MLSDFIPHETITIDDRYPPWINCKIKHLINEKNAAYNNYLKNNKTINLFQRFSTFRVN